MSAEPCSHRVSGYPENVQKWYGVTSRLHDQVLPFGWIYRISHCVIREDLCAITYLIVSFPSFGAMTCPVRVED